MELVGPAGAGKSAVAKALEARDPRIHADLSLWGLPRPLLLRGALSLIPTVLEAATGARPLRAGELGQMVRLEALQRAADRAARKDCRLLVMDEGPVFALSYLDVFFARNGDAGWARWRRQVVWAWAGLLDAVVYLDAADALLATRIRTRSKPHLVKDLSEPAIYQFTARFRQAFRRVIADLRQARRVSILALRTDQDSPGQLALRLRLALEDLRGR